MSADDRAQFESNMRQFIQTELETGIAFASVALDEETGDKRDRNQQNARKAYDTAQHFLREHAPEDMTAQPGLLDRLTRLRDLLIQLGEKVER